MPLHVANSITLKVYLHDTKQLSSEEFNKIREFGFQESDIDEFRNYYRQLIDRARSKFITFAETEKSVLDYLNDMSDPNNPNFIPEHPELYYRITKKWKGWWDFLSKDKEETKRQDDLEDKAWEILKANPAFSGKYDHTAMNLWEEYLRIA